MIMKHFILTLTLLQGISAKMIFDFNINSDIQNWNVVDDTVMGGRSSSQFSLNSEGFGVFKGVVSLENNGGFSSVRHRLKKTEVKKYTKIKLRLKGDGKNYQFRVKNNSRDYHSYISTFSTTNDWQNIEIALKEDDELIIESFLDGTEVSVGVIRYKGKVTVLPITEIVTKNDFFDYEAKYLGRSQEITPARLSKIQAHKVKEVAKNIYEILKLDGFSRSEFIFKDDKPYLLEVNTIPGFTKESILPQQALKAGISLSDLFHNAIVEALKKNH